MNQIPAVVVAGFLDSGKTTYINNRFAQGDFAGERLAVFLCEAGEVELDRTACRAKALLVAEINTPQSLEKELETLSEKHRPDRILIEMNGTWQFSRWMPMLKEYLKINSVVMIINGECFFPQFQNLRHYLVDPLPFATQVMINRPGSSGAIVRDALIPYSRLAAFHIETKTGEYAMQEMHMTHSFPGSGLIWIEAEEFVSVYRDILLHPEFFDGRYISVCGELICDREGNWMIEQRIMVCCAQDTLSVFFPCVFDTIVPSFGTWMRVTGRLNYAYHRFYGGVGPILTVENMECAPDVFEEM